MEVKFTKLVTFDLPVIMIKNREKGYRVHSRGTLALRRYVLKELRELEKTGEVKRIQQSVYLMTDWASERFRKVFFGLVRNPWKALRNTRLERWEKIKLEKIFEKAEEKFRFIEIEIRKVTFRYGG